MAGIYLERHLSPSETVSHTGIDRLLSYRDSSDPIAVVVLSEASPPQTASHTGIGRLLS
jgi:hypothetical protein